MSSNLGQFGNRSQLQVFGVPPPKKVAILRDGKATVSTGGHLSDGDAGDVAPQFCGGAGDVVVTKAWFGKKNNTSWLTRPALQGFAPAQLTLNLSGQN